MLEHVVCALYKFVTLDQFEDLRKPLLHTMLQHDVCGTLLLASEGINGTVSGTRQSIDALIDWLQAMPEFSDLKTKESISERKPFRRTKVKLKKEIVTMGVEGIDPLRVVGTYVAPEQWNDLIRDPEVLVLDTRNSYEIEVGTFDHAVNPEITSFREFPEYIRKNLDPSKHKKVAMFCTGGIRCEKSTAYLKEQGFDEVYHLKGGILKYLEQVDEADSIWQGECFVFDDRVTVNAQLEPGQYDQCNACRMPITKEDQLSPLFQRGVSCPRCHDHLSDEQKNRFAEREKQMQLAKTRGEAHLGKEVQASMQINRLNKQAIKERQRVKDKHP